MVNIYEPYDARHLFQYHQFSTNLTNIHRLVTINIIIIKKYKLKKTRNW